MALATRAAQTAAIGADRPGRRALTGVFHRFGWVLPVVVTAVVVRYQAARPQLWRDELATWWAATRSPTGFDRLTSHIDAVFVPYYRFMHVWIELFGDSALSLRTPSMLAVAATAGVVAALGAVLGSRPAGVLGGLVFAALPSTSRYGQEARPYALAALAATTATLLLLLALRHMKWWYWAGYAVALGLAGSLHMIALLILAGHLVAVVWTAVVRRSWWPFRWAGGAVALAVAPVVPLVLRGHQQVGLQLGNRVVRPDAFAMGRLPQGILGGATAGGLVLALAVVGALLCGRKGALFGLMTLAPALTFLLAAQVAPIYTLRYVFFLAAPAAVLAGMTLARFRLAAGLAVILLLAFLGLHDQDTARLSHESPGSVLIDYHRAALIVAAWRQSGDAIVYDRAGWQFADLGTEYYLRGDTPDDALAEQSRNAAGSYWTPEQTDPEAALAGRNRVWWVDPINLGTHKFDPLPGPAAAVLKAHYRQVGFWPTSGFQVRLFQRV